MTASAEVTLLGRFAVSVDGRPVPIRSPNERALLARLALEPGTVVAVDRLIAAIWPDGDRPDDPARALRYHVWHLRDLLEPGRAARSDGMLLLTGPGGYRLAVDPEAVDACRLEAAWAAVRRLDDDPRRRRDALEALLADWHPAAFAEGTVGPLAEAATRLDRLRATALGERIAADLALGRDVGLVAELEQLVAAHPLDEGLRGQLMVALYRAGRQADALAVYTSTRQVLVEELGVDPGPVLRELEQRILRHDASLDGPPPTAAGARPTTPAADQPTNLPHPVDSFVGRERELTEVRRLLGDFRLVTLTGAGGIGKTRLAVEAGRRLVGDHPDGVWIAELAPVVDEELVAMVVAETWGLNAPAAEVDDLVVAFLRRRHLLLVIDNCEHVSGAASRLVSRILREVPAVRILATSRESLGVAGEAVLPVPGLALGGEDGTAGASAALFVDRGLAARPSWVPEPRDHDAIDRICQRLDGIPLGLELAAGRLRSMAPAEIADHLDHSLGLLAVAAKRSLPRHRALAATVEWSYRLLSGPEQALFRRCSVFTGGFDGAAALAVGGGPGATAVDVEDVLDSLVDKSLVLATPALDGTRYRLLEPLRQWAYERLVAEGEMQGVRRAHAHHYAQLVGELSAGYHRAGQEQALRRTLTEYPNVRVALTTLAEFGDADRHLEVCFRLFSLWAHQSMHLEGFLTCGRSLHLATPDTDLLPQVKAAFVGSVCGAWTRRPAAVTMAVRGRELAERLGDPRSIGWAELALAIVYGNDGPPRGVVGAEVDTAMVEAMQRAIDRWAAHPGPAWWDPMWERGLQQLCSSIFLPAGPARFEEFLASQAAFRSVGDLGWLAILYAQALDHIEHAGAEATRQVLEEGARITVSPNWSNGARYRLGILHQRLGDHRQAVAELSASLAYNRAAGDDGATADARFLAISECELGHLALAARIVEGVFAVVAHERSEREVRRTLAVAAHVLTAAAEHDLAARAVGRAAPFQDNFVDTIGSVRSRLVAALGAPVAEALVADGAGSELVPLVAEVRRTLAALSRVSETA
jgi:predicted ATPase/DNA-binding SARP family transcriptional activator